LVGTSRKGQAFSNELLSTSHQQRAPLTIIPARDGVEDMAEFHHGTIAPALSGINEPGQIAAPMFSETG
jgi:hypothetical protein